MGHYTDLKYWKTYFIDITNEIKESFIIKNKSTRTLYDF